MKSACAAVCALVLLAVPNLGAASSMRGSKTPPLHQWLLSQRVSACFPWFLWNLTLSTSVPAGDLLTSDEALSYHMDDTRADALLENGTKEVRQGSDGMESLLRVVYDGKIRTALLRQQGYEENSTVMMADVAAPPSAIAPASLASYRTKLGVRLGMTSADVAKIFGKPKKVLAGCGMTAFGYAASPPPPWPPGCSNDYTFVFKRERLMAASFSESC